MSDCQGKWHYWPHPKVKQCPECGMECRCLSHRYNGVPEKHLSGCPGCAYEAGFSAGTDNGMTLVRDRVQDVLRLIDGLADFSRTIHDLKYGLENLLKGN